MQATEAIAIGVTYIATSSSLIAFNKYLMQPGRFSHAGALTAIHMSVTFLMSLLLYVTAPSVFPSMQMAKAKWKTVLWYIAPLGLLFSIALVCSNLAYRYSSVAFLQFCKQGNVALIFVMSCLVGIQVFSWQKVFILAIVVAGCSLCAHGEIHFVMLGLVLQLASQFMECSKNLLGELAMSQGGGLRLDVLTFVLFQAPFSLVPLLVSAAFTYTPDVASDFVAMWPMLLANALVAFFLNVLIALTLKRLSALAFVIIGLLKDAVIVASSSFMFGDPISDLQKLGFTVTITGIVLWSRLKMQEAAEKKQANEKSPLLPQHGQTQDSATKSK